MAKVKIQGNASGTGILTVTAPNTSTDRTITLPDSTGTLLTSDGDGSNLTGVTATDSTKLPLAGGSMTGDILPGTNSVHFADNGKAKFGGGEDLQIYHDGSHSYVYDAGVGDLKLQSEGNIILERQSSGGATMLKAVVDGTVELYHDNTKKLETTSDGVYIAKQTTGDLRVGNFVANGTGEGVKVAADSNQGSVHIETALTGTRNMILLTNGNGLVGTIQTTGGGTNYNTSSDYRLKENVDYTWDATTRLKQLKPCRFNFIAEDSVTVDGFLAHEVQDIVPEAISGTKDEVDVDGNAVHQGIDQSKLVPLLVKTIQELEARITELENA